MSHLIEVSKLDVPVAIRLNLVFKGFCAVDLESGAFLSRTSDRPLAGNGYKYVLTLLKDNQDRKFIRAWGDSEAIELANKMISGEGGE